MSIGVKITCPKCGGIRHDIILELRDGHKIPIGFRCLEEGCGWQGRDRLMVFSDNPNASSASARELTSKSIGQLRDEAIERGDYIDTKRGFKKSAPKTKALKSKTQAPSVPVAEVIVPMLKPLDHDLLSTTPIVCPSCEQPVIELWASFTGVIEKPAGATLLASMKCSVCGELISHNALTDKFNPTPIVVSLFEYPSECNNCHITPDKYPIAGNLVFSWNGGDWQCSGEARLICPGCSNILSIYNIPKTC